MIREFIGLLAGCALIALIQWAGSPASKRNPGRLEVPARWDRAGIAEELSQMVVIPGGSFLMGVEGTGSDSPKHLVHLHSFLMDRTEVTCRSYLSFCQATGHHLPFFWNRPGFNCGEQYPDYPVVGISWHDAQAYAEWAGKRLPTEAEWEYAARGGHVDWKYPHGNELTPADGNYGSSELDGTVRVGSYPPNGYGLFDMMGNVVEWVRDRYGETYYGESPEWSPEGPDTGRFRVIRGGGWKSGPGCVSIAHRNALPSNWVDFNVGFRCVRDIPEQDAPSK